MPELPEVETMVRGVRDGITGCRISRMEFCRCSRKPISVHPPAARFAAQIRNRLITAVHRLGKRIILDLCRPPELAVATKQNTAFSMQGVNRSPEFAPELHIVIEPRMTGLLLIADPPTTAHRRICWHLVDSVDSSQRTGKLEFWDRRGLGTVSLIDVTQLSRLTESLGPDALTMTMDSWTAALRHTRRPIKVALLDQKLVAGIGNLYASEILHRSRIGPSRPASDLSAAETARLADATTAILQQAVRCEGSTLNDGTYRNALNQDGSFQNHHQVYGREGQPCLRCRRSVIRRIVQAQRSTFLCPQCQK